MSPDADQADNALLLDVVTTLTANARRVTATAVEGVDPADTDALVAAVTAALGRETRGIVAGVPDDNRPLAVAVEAAGRALEAVAVQALRTSTAAPAEALDRAFELFGSYVTGPGRAQILADDDGR